MELFIVTNRGWCWGRCWCFSSCWCRRFCWCLGYAGGHCCGWSTSHRWSNRCRRGISWCWGCAYTKWIIFSRSVTANYSNNFHTGNIKYVSTSNSDSLNAIVTINYRECSSRTSLCSTIQEPFCTANIRLCRSWCWSRCFRSGNRRSICWGCGFCTCVSWSIRCCWCCRFSGCWCRSNTSCWCLCSCWSTRRFVTWCDTWGWSNTLRRCSTWVRSTCRCSGN